MAFFMKGGGDTHPILRHIGQFDVEDQRLALVKVVIMTTDMSLVLFDDKGHIHSLALIRRLADLRGGGEGELAEGQG